MSRSDCAYETKTTVLKCYNKKLQLEKTQFHLYRYRFSPSPVLQISPCLSAGISIWKSTTHQPCATMSLQPLTIWQIGGQHLQRLEVECLWVDFVAEELGQEICCKYIKSLRQNVKILDESNEKQTGRIFVWGELMFESPIRFFEKQSRHVLGYAKLGLSMTCSRGDWVQIPSFFQPPPGTLEPTWYHSFLGSTCKTTSASPAAAETTCSSEKSCAGTPQFCGGVPPVAVPGQRASGSGNNLRSESGRRVFWVKLGVDWANDVDSWPQKKFAWLFMRDYIVIGSRYSTKTTWHWWQSRKEDLFKVSWPQIHTWYPSITLAKARCIKSYTLTIQCQMFSSTK